MGNEVMINNTHLKCVWACFLLRDLAETNTPPVKALLHKATTTWFLVLCHFKTQNRCGREQFMFIVLLKKLKHSDSWGIFIRGRLFIENYWMRHEVFIVFNPKYRWGREQFLFCLFVRVCKPDEGGDTEQVIKLSWPKWFFLFRDKILVY